MKHKKMQEKLRVIPGFNNILYQVAENIVEKSIIACVTTVVEDTINADGGYEILENFSNYGMCRSNKLGDVCIPCEEYEDFLSDLENFEQEVYTVSDLMKSFNNHVDSITAANESLEHSLFDLLDAALDTDDLFTLSAKGSQVVEDVLLKFSNAELASIVAFIKKDSLYKEYIEAIGVMTQACPDKLTEIMCINIAFKEMSDTIVPEDYLQVVLPYVFWGALTNWLDSNTDVFTTINDSFEEEYEAPYEYWVVDEWLADKLAGYGEMVNKDDFAFAVWGRQCTGQAIAMDSCIQDIALEYDLASYCFDKLQYIYKIKRNQQAVEKLNNLLLFMEEEELEITPENCYELIMSCSSVSKYYCEVQQYAMFDSIASILAALNVTDLELISKIREKSKDSEEKQCLSALHGDLTYIEKGSVIKVLLTISEKKLNVPANLREFFIERLAKLMDLLANVSKNKYVSEFDTSKLVYHETLDSIKEYKQILSICKEYNMGTDFISEEFFEDLEKE